MPKQKTCVVWNENTPCTNKKRAPTHRSKNAKTKLNHTTHTVLSKYHKNILHSRHLACARHFVASHCTIPPKRKNNYLGTKLKVCANTKILTSFFAKSHQTIPCKTALVTTNEMAPCTNKKFKKLASHGYIAQCHHTHASFFMTAIVPRSAHESVCASALEQTRIRMKWIRSNAHTHGLQCVWL